MDQISVWACPVCNRWNVEKDDRYDNGDCCKYCGSFITLDESIIFDVVDLDPKSAPG